MAGGWWRSPVWCQNPLSPIMKMKNEFSLIWKQNVRLLCDSPPLTESTPYPPCLVMVGIQWQHNVWTMTSSWTTCRQFVTVWIVTQTPVAWKSCCCSWVAFWVWSLKADELHSGFGLSKQMSCILGLVSQSRWVAIRVRFLTAFVTSRWWWCWVVECGHPLQDKLVTFPVRRWQVQSLLMTHCDKLNCLATERSAGYCHSAASLWPSISHSLLNAA